MKRLSVVFRIGMVALLLCGLSGTAFAQTPAQRLAAWSQAIMQQRIDRADAERDVAVAKLEAQVRQTEQKPEILPDADQNLGSRLRVFDHGARRAGE